MKIKSILLVLLYSFCSVLAQDYSQTFLSLKNTGVEDFLKKHPQYDGRGTIIFVLDTGIDVGIDGLKKTSTDQVKVIDVQDFTGEGDIGFIPAEIKEENGVKYFVDEKDAYKVAGVDKLSFKPEDGKYFIGLLPEKLWLNSNSGVTDINGNGKENDQFYFVTFKTTADGKEFWVLYLDTNTNGDLADEKPFRNYKENFDAFVIPNEKGLARFTMALNVFPEEKRVSFFFDDGGHGTHCSGITAGFKIGDEQLNGVAPGANLIGLKIGNNNYPGGATVTESMKNAYLYADKISKERKEPCIITMSYGIGSEIEGQADMEKFLEDLTAKNPYLYICTSNGNDGPGISTAGLPAASYAVLSSGAALAEEVGNDLYGAMTGKDIILHFSSRGGEVRKPDIISPGAAASTIPNYAGGDVMWGTSMASPYTAGVVSLLLSAAKVDFRDVKIPSPFLFKVIRESATKLEGYTHLDQGGGYINAGKAYELLTKYIKAGEISKFETYTTTSFAPNMPKQQAQNLYIRNGSYIKSTDNFTFTIKRNNFSKQDKFYRIYNIKSDSDWLIPIQRKLHLRNDQNGYVNVKFDRSKMTSPGLYNGMIYGTRADQSNTPEIEMMATVVIPYQFNSQNDYSMIAEDQELAPGMHKRFFFEIPYGTSVFHLRFSAEENKFAAVRFVVHDPNGVAQLFGIFNAQGPEDFADRYLTNPEPGVYELVALGNFNSKANSFFNLLAEVDGIKRMDKDLLGENNHSIQLENILNKVCTYNVSGEISGYQKECKVHMDSVSTYDIPFVLKKGEKSKAFTIEISKEDFNKVTDFTFAIYDSSGKALSSGGLSYCTDNISIDNSFKSDITKLKLVLIPAYANAAGKMDVNITEITDLENHTPIKFKSGSLTFYPMVNQSIPMDFKKPDFVIPTDSKFCGKIEFKSMRTSNTVFEIPLLFDLK
jgi:subtilisin family serine protease